MGDIIWGHTFPRNPQSGAKDTQIRTREDAVDHLATELRKMLDEGDTLLVLECQNGETLSVHNDPSAMNYPTQGLIDRVGQHMNASIDRALHRSDPVEMPADCPA